MTGRRRETFGVDHFFILLLMFVTSPGQVLFTPDEVDPVVTTVSSPGIGNIAVRIEIPEKTRYPEGAPVVVEVSTWFVSFAGFHRVNDTRRIGAVTVSYLWPQRGDPETGAYSEGVYDYGGPLSLAVLRDVIKFAAGLIPNIDGQTIDELVAVPLLTDNIGLFASSHSGVVATNVLAHHGNEISTVKYLVGRENPTRDEMYPLELGYFNDLRRPIHNPFYDEECYSPTTVSVDYSTVGWYQPPGEPQGRPYFAAKDTLPDHILHETICPKMWGKRYYSRAITQALLENGALTLDNWPEDLATPAETQAAWPFRITVYNYPLFITKAPHLKVMLVFSRDDHVQAARTKPHIHQAWDGFYETAGLWVRMNPDRAYVQSLDPGYGLAFPDNPANTEPTDWYNIRDWGFPADAGTRENVWSASVAEMADRVQMDDWSEDLDSVYYPVLIESEETGIPGRPACPPESPRLLQNYPNPFNSSTHIVFYLPRPDHVRLVIFNLRGEAIEELVNEDLLPGDYHISWSGWGRPSGIYVCRVEIGDFVEILKLILKK